MFEFINDREDRGQVGIGTLIVFIAMVLVAAIAAGVLINTAGFLQSQAEATGQESTDLVSERIDVTSEVGIVGNNSTGELKSVNVTVSGAAGADQIDLSESTIQAVGPNGQANLVFTDTPASGSGDIGNASQLNASEFAVLDSDGGFVDSGNAVLDDDTDYTIVVNPGAEPFGDMTNDDIYNASGSNEYTYAHTDSSLSAFGEGESSSLEIVSPSSATTSVELNAPDLFTEDGEAVRL
ncbi:archaellin/type IV pilin N-terminal domain-containing protein [Halorubrum sp. AJ67]|uniref:archaellin/type IV pilin N-terminal domain-containing protein n=1 Tax=Halorubrum sp. AJ67 TaxID=1173487 RepID=UPI0003DD7858|nr:archaellin/type IV pilin N-terminal domain-containing protein [Halorubrum sp. AJ67]CDK40519.1 flagellin [Halorubrum sp. AJ67]